MWGREKIVVHKCNNQILYYPNTILTLYGFFFLLDFYAIFFLSSLSLSPFIFSQLDLHFFFALSLSNWPRLSLLDSIVQYSLHSRKVKINLRLPFTSFICLISINFLSFFSPLTHYYVGDILNEWWKHNNNKILQTVANFLYQYGFVLLGLCWWSTNAIFFVDIMTPF